MRRIDLGVASYGSPNKLDKALSTIRRNTVSDLRVFVIHNPGSSEDSQARKVIGAHALADSRIHPVWMDTNEGYAGAVNKLLSLSETDITFYADNDVEILTPGWDEEMATLLEENAECGWVFPGSGHYGFFNGKYHECLWNAGYCWALRMDARAKLEQREAAMFNPAYLRAGYMNAKLGHHDEVDLMVRLRLAGYQIGCCPSVNVLHHETATHADSADHKPGGRIHDGVVRWMNFHNNYFCGYQLEYSMTKYDDRALRYTDWHPCALYLERMTLALFPDWNKEVETVNVPGVGPMDSVKVLKPAGPYQGRAI